MQIAKLGEPPKYWADLGFCPKQRMGAWPFAITIFFFKIYHNKISPISSLLAKKGHKQITYFLMVGQFHLFRASLGIGQPWIVLLRPVAHFQKLEWKKIFVRVVSFLVVRFPLFWNFEIICYLSDHIWIFLRAQEQRIVFAAHIWD